MGGDAAPPVGGDPWTRERNPCRWLRWRRRAPQPAPGAAAADSSASAAPAPASQRREPDPNATHFEVALRAAFGVPLGSALPVGLDETDVSMSDVDSFTIPVQLDAGVRLGGSWFLGGYFSYGFGGSDEGVLQRVFLWRRRRQLLAEHAALRRPGALASAGQRLDRSVGRDRLRLREGEHRGQRPERDGSLDLSGWEFANLQLGVDFALGSSVQIGPWVSFSVGQYSSAAGSSGDPAPRWTSTNKTVHEWFMGGVRLVILP